MSLLRAAAPALAALLLLAPPASAHTVAGSYTIGATPGVSLVCSPNCLGTPLNIGGYTFPANGEQPIRVDIVDSVSADVAFTVCQDLNGQLCGEAGEPRVEGCGSIALLSNSAVAFRPNVPVSVFVRIVDPNCVPNIAVSGTITITYSP